MEKTFIYLDNSATTCPSEASLEKMREALSVSYGNAGSVHAMGNAAHRLLEEARNALGLTVGIRRPQDGHVIFTAGGSESNNLAIFGSIRAKERDGGRVFITDGEHPSVNECANELEKQGFEVFRVPTVGGVLDLDYLRKNCDKTTVLASFMLVNNETGAVYDVAEAARIVRERAPRAFIHCDAVQGYLKTRFTLKSLGVDAVSVSGHKVNAPKGVGALFITAEVIKSKRLVPVTLGGGQESGFRSGTENIPAIAALGVAAIEGFREMASRHERIASLRALLERELCGAVRINRPEKGLDSIANMTLPNIKSETMLNYLSGEGICISAGSACSARGGGVSRALTAFGILPEEADCSVRVSLSHLNSEEEIIRFAATLRDGISKLARIK
ncbi:MAG: cysteine desulfurase [Ruminococcaceae bacterium]|nr:cysteine desulfurase [Oscillospiraceae bacterium]